LAIIVLFFALSTICWGNEKDKLNLAFNNMIHEIITCSYVKGYENFKGGNTCKKDIEEALELISPIYKMPPEMKDALIEISENCFHLGALNRIVGKYNLEKRLKQYNDISKKYLK
jgi:hypothetical protein